MLSWRLTNCTTTLGHHSKTRLGSLYIGITGESIRLKCFPELQNLNFIIQLHGFGIYICESNQFRKKPQVAESCFINTLKSVILHTENASVRSLMLFDSGKFKEYHCCAKQKTHINNKDMLKYKSRKIIAPALPQ